MVPGGVGWMSRVRVVLRSWLAAAACEQLLRARGLDARDAWGV